MTFTTIGDLAQSFQLRRDNARIDADLQRLAEELASGRKSDPTAAFGGDFRALSGLERSISSLGSYAISASEAGLAATAVQDVLGRIGEDALALSNDLLLVREVSDPQLVNSAGADARGRFADAVAGLNTSVAGRTLFAGEAFDGPALADPEMILADLLAAVGAQATATDVLTAVDTWFAPGGGFETSAFVGSSVTADPVRIADGVEVEPLRLATDPAIAETLKGVATAALLDLGVLTSAPSERATLAREVGVRLLSANTDFIDLRADVGVAQERIASTEARIASEEASYQLARTELLASDPYETALRLQAAEAQLQTLYTITGRLSQLSLARFLR